MSLSIKILCLSIFTFWLNSLFGQNVFDVKLNGGVFHSFVLTKDSGFVTHIPEPNLFSNGGTIIKVNKWGEITDSIFNPSLQSLGANYTILNANEGYVIVGETYKELVVDGWGTDIIVEKIDEDANIVWQLGLEGIYMIDAIRTTDNHFLVLGEILEQPDFGMLDIVLYKVNENGEVVWKKQIGNRFLGEYDDSYFESARGLYEINKSYYFSYYNSYGLTSEAKLAKLNEDGEVLWTIQDDFNILPNKGIVSIFELNNTIYFLNNDNFKVFELNPDNGEYKFITNTINIRRLDGGSTNFEVSCNELIVVDYSGVMYKYTDVEEKILMKENNFSAISRIKKTLDGGYAMLNIHGRFIKTDCKGNIDFWDEECTKRLKAGEEVIIYPNPTTGILNIETNFDIRKIVVLDNIGKEVIYKNYCNCGKQSIDVSAYTPGTYFLKIVGSDNFEVVRFVKD